MLNSNCYGVDHHFNLPKSETLQVQSNRIEVLHSLFALRDNSELKDTSLCPGRMKFWIPVRFEKRQSAWSAKAAVESRRPQLDSRHEMRW